MDTPEENCEKPSAAPQESLEKPDAEVSKRPIRYGLLKGRICIAEDFDAPLPADILDSFEQE
jgi:hypothetical protein